MFDTRNENVTREKKASLVFYSSNTHFKENKIVENFLLTTIKNPITKKSMKLLDEITRDSTEIGETYFDVVNTHY